MAIVPFGELLVYREKKPGRRSAGGGRQMGVYLKTNFVLDFL
jgi:hypothetical protein